MTKICRVCKVKLYHRNRTISQGNICRRCHAERFIDYYWSHPEYRERKRELSRIRNHCVGTALDPGGIGSSQTQIIYETTDKEKLEDVLEKEMKRLGIK